MTLRGIVASVFAFCQISVHTGIDDPVSSGQSFPTIRSRSLCQMAPSKKVSRSGNASLPIVTQGRLAAGALARVYGMWSLANSLRCKGTNRRCGQLKESCR
jgi:hypothetical protein